MGFLTRSAFQTLSLVAVAFLNGNLLRKFSNRNAFALSIEVLDSGVKVTALKNSFSAKVYVIRALKGRNKVITVKNVQWNYKMHRASLRSANSYRMIIGLEGVSRSSYLGSSQLNFVILVKHIGRK